MECAGLEYVIHTRELERQEGCQVTCEGLQEEGEWQQQLLIHTGQGVVIAIYSSRLSPFISEESQSTQALHSSLSNPVPLYSSAPFQCSIPALHSSAPIQHYSNYYCNTTPTQILYYCNTTHTQLDVHRTHTPRY